MIYIGKAQTLHQRLKNHNHCPKKCYEELDYIEFVKLNSIDEAEYLEKYLVSKIKPKYNVDFVNLDIGFNIEIFDNLKWNLYDDNVKSEMKQVNMSLKKDTVDSIKKYSKENNITESQVLSLMIDTIYNELLKEIDTFSQFVANNKLKKD